MECILRAVLNILVTLQKADTKRDVRWKGSTDTEGDSSSYFAARTRWNTSKRRKQWLGHFTV